MRVLLLLAGLALGIGAAAGVEAKDEENFVKNREIRATWDNKKKPKPRPQPRPPPLPNQFTILSDIKSREKRENVVKNREIRTTWGDRKRPPPLPNRFTPLSLPTKRREKREDRSKENKKNPRPLPGAFTPLDSPAKTPEKRGNERLQRRPEKCPGCYSFLLPPTAQKGDPTSLTRQIRDTEEHEKRKKKDKHLKEKRKGRRRSKNHKDRPAHFQREDPEIGDNNNKRRKHHRGKKERAQFHSGKFSALAAIPMDRNMMHMDLHDKI